ncbi:MAG: addiction module protein [Opitutaceae bacterium]
MPRARFPLMPTTLPLKSMTKIEKLRAMEALWVDLTRDEASFDSPQWHLRELQKTEARVAAGKEKFIDWEEAKKSLRRRAR